MPNVVTPKDSVNTINPFELQTSPEQIQEQADILKGTQNIWHIHDTKFEQDSSPPVPSYDDIRIKVLKQMMERSSEAIASAILLNGISLVNHLNHHGYKNHGMNDIYSFKGYLSLAQTAQAMTMDSEYNNKITPSLEKIKGVLQETLCILSALTYKTVTTLDVSNLDSHCGIIDAKARIFADVKAMLDVAFNSSQPNDDLVFLYWGDTAPRPGGLIFD